MEIVRNYIDLKRVLPNNKIVGKVTTDRKADGEYHAGHVNTITTMVNNCETSFVTVWSWQPFYKAFFPNDDVVVTDENWDGESYTISFMENLGVDVLFIPEYNYHTELFVTENASTTLAAGDALIAAEGYELLKPSYIDPISWKTLRMQIAADYLLIRYSNMYPRDLYFISDKDGLLTYFFKHYVEKYSSTIVNIVPTLLRPDGLPYSTTLINARQEFIDFAIECNNLFSANLNNLQPFNYRQDMPSPSGGVVNAQAEIMSLIEDENKVYRNMIFNISIVEDDNIIGPNKKIIEAFIEGMNYLGDKPIRLIYII